MPSKPLTLRDVARAVGLSPAAVSLALRGEGTLSAATRARIQEAARRMRYRRNVYAASLRTRSLTGSGHGMPLAVLVGQSGGAQYPVVPARLGLRRAARELGYALEEVVLTAETPLRAVLRGLFHRGCQGLFLPHTLDTAAIPPPDWARFCVVVCNRGAAPPVFHTVRASAFDAVVQAMELLHARGSRRIGAALFRHDPPILDDANREAAYSWSLQKLGLPPLEPFLAPHGDMTGYARWFRSIRPDAVLGFHIGCWHALPVRSGRKKPAFCCLHLDDHPAARGLSGFPNPDQDIGRTAVLLMDSLIRHHDRGMPRDVRETLLQRQFREGRTMPAPRT